MTQATNSKSIAHMEEELRLLRTQLGRALVGDQPKLARELVVKVAHLEQEIEDHEPECKAV